MQKVERYSQRGVSAKKEDVHEAIKHLNKGLFPQAFCKIVPDYLANDPTFCNIMHADGAGTKIIIAYLYWKATGDESVWKDIAQDAIVMNLDDLLCVGARGPFLLSSVITRNKHLIDGTVVSGLITGINAVIGDLKNLGVEIISTGGETEDLGDLIRTVGLNVTMTGRMKVSDVIDNQNIVAGDVIVGLSSSGKCSYERHYNSGIGSNGLTSARHDLLNKSLMTQYPESYDPNTNEEFLFCGPYSLTEKIGELNMPLGKLLLSPTRSYAPILLNLPPELFSKIHGIIHCTGGGQTKVLNFIGDLHIVKDNLFSLPPIFEMIQKESSCSWEEMYKVFNMGHRLEIYTDIQTAEQIINQSKEFSVEAKIIGKVESHTQKKLTINSEFGTFKY